MSESLRFTVRYEDAGEGWVSAQVVEVPGRGEDVEGSWRSARVME